MEAKRCYTVKDLQEILGIYEADLYTIWKKNDIETITVDYVKRISKDVFEKWYVSQTKYHKLEHIPTSEELESDYILVNEAAELLDISRDEAAALVGVTKSTITKWMQAEKFTCVGAGKVLRIRRDDFLQWINQNVEVVK